MVCVHKIIEMNFTEFASNLSHGRIFHSDTTHQEKPLHDLFYSNTVNVELIGQVATTLPFHFELNKI